MKSFTIFLLILLYATAGKAQSATIDSLYRQVMATRDMDYRLVNQLLVALDAEGITDSLIVVGRQQDDDQIRKDVCYYMGLFYNNTYRTVNAADAFTKAVGYARLTDDRQREAECLSAAAVQYHKLGRFERAIDYCIQALHIDSVLCDTLALSCDLNILSGSSLSAGYVDDALRYIMKAIEWEQARPTPTQIAIRYGSAAEILNKKGDTQQALHYATLAYEADKRAGNTIGVARRMSQMADIYTHMKDYDGAHRYYQRAIDTLEAHQELHSLTIDYRLLGNVLQQQGRHEEALRNYQRAEQLARQTGNRFFLFLTARSMAESHRALGHTAQAVDYLMLALELGDSLHNEKTAQMTADFRSQFELQEHNDRANRQKSLVGSLQLVIGLLGAMLIACLAVIVLLWRRRSGKQEVAEAYNIPLENKKADRMTAADRKLLTDVSNYVHANMKQRKITIDMIAEELGMSRNQFARRLTNASGEAPSNYLMSIRMEKAVRLLRDTSLSVKEIAYECGFDESNYFIHVFRQRYHVTPQQFRNTPKLIIDN